MSKFVRKSHEWSEGFTIVTRSHVDHEMGTDARVEVLHADAPPMAEDLTRRIRAEVDVQFQHVIDPQAGDAEQQAKLNALHHGPNTDAILRC